MLGVAVLAFNYEVDKTTFTFNKSGFSGEWEITVAGEHKFSNGSSIQFSLPVGTPYTYTAKSLTPGYQIKNSYGTIASSVPYWVTLTGFAVGGAIGIGGGVVGVTAGALAGALVANYLYNLFYGTAQNHGVNLVPYLQNMWVTENNMFNESGAYATTLASLITASYYYFSLLGEYESLNFLNLSALNNTRVLYLSGIYGDVANISALVYGSENEMAMNFYNWYQDGISSTTNGLIDSYTTANCPAYPYESVQNSPSYIGYQLATGSYFIGNANSQFFFQGKENITYTNIITNITKTISASSTPTTYNLAGKTINMALGSSSFFTKNIGIFKIDSISIDTSNANSNTFTLYTSGVPINVSTGQIINTFNTEPNNILAVWANSNGNQFESLTAFSVFQTGTSSSTGGSFISFFNTNSFSPINEYPEHRAYLSISPFQQLDSTFTTISTDASSTIDGYFNALKESGYNNASQVPASNLVLPPSFSIPLSMLNGTFNVTELTAIYYSYLHDLQNWFLHHPKQQYNTTISNSTFQNNMGEEYGNLTLYNGTGYQYLNNTNFLFMTDLPHINFSVGRKTYFNSTGVQAIVLSDPPAYPVGTLLNIGTGSTFYSISLSLNGTNTSKISIYPAPINVILPHISKLNSTSLTTGNNGGFFVSASNFLAKYYIIVTGLLLMVVAIAYVRYNDKDKRGKKE